MKGGNNGLQQEPTSICQRHKDTSEVSEVEEESSPVGRPLATADARVQKERSKSLAIFGTSVSPKLRSAQFSFETDLWALKSASGNSGRMWLLKDTNGSRNIIEWHFKETNSQNSEGLILSSLEELMFTVFVAPGSPTRLQLHFCVLVHRS